MEKVLVTGVSGFLGHHCAVELLKTGYYIRGSVRDFNKKSEVLNGIKKEIDPNKRLEFVKLDFLSDDGSFEADDKYKSDGLANLKGGLYHGYGGGYKIDDKISVEAVYKHNYGKYDSYILFVGDSKYDLVYTRLNISLIYTY